MSFVDEKPTSALLALSTTREGAWRREKERVAALLS